MIYGHITHDIGLSTNSNKTVDVLADWHQDLASHVSAFLCARSLIFDMNTSSTLLNEHFGQLHDSSQTTVSSVSIGNDWSEEIGVSKLRSLRFWHAQSFFSLFSVVKQLCEPEVLYFLRYSVLSRVSAKRGWIERSYHRVIR